MSLFLGGMNGNGKVTVLIHLTLRFGHENISAAILILLLIQEAYLIFQPQYSNIAGCR